MPTMLTLRNLGAKKSCVQNRVQLAPPVPHLAIDGPLYVLDLS
jgi:hypothetical protein